MTEGDVMSDKIQLKDSVKQGIELLNSRGLTGDIFGLKVSSLSYSIKDNEVINGSQEEDIGLAFRVVKDNKIGFSFTVPGKEKKGINKALELANLSSRVSASKQFSLPEPRKGAKVKTYDQDISDAIKDERGSNTANKMIEGVNLVSNDIRATQGYLGLSSSLRVLANSNGVFKSEKITGTGASVTASIAGEDSSITANEIQSSRQLDLKGKEIGQKAGDKVNDLRERSKKTETGRLPVLLSPEALSQLLGNTIIPSLYAENIRRDKSVYKGQLGEKVADSNLTLRENPTDDWGLGSSRFDDEGVVSRNVPLIKDGQLTNFLYDLKESVKWEEEKASTANGIRNGFKSPPKTSARNLIVKEGNYTKKELLAESKIYVDRILGAHTADAVSGDFSVVINPGWLLVEGEKRGRLDGFLLSGNLPQLLQTIKLADDSKCVSMGHSMRLPSCLLPEVTVAGSN